MIKFDGKRRNWLSFRELFVYPAKGYRSCAVKLDLIACNTTTFKNVIFFTKPDGSTFAKERQKNINFPKLIITNHLTGPTILLFFKN